MQINIGQIDRALRIIAGVALLVWAAFLNGPFWAYIGILPLVTGLLKWCPAYTVLGIKTCK
jgi:Protein of unknown function (DUF2892)